MDLPAMDVGFHKGIDAYAQVRFAGNVPCKSKVCGHVSRCRHQWNSYSMYCALEGGTPLALDKH